MKKAIVKKESKAKNELKLAMFGAGCFWGVEESFRKLPGVVNTEVGYAGGDKNVKTYEEVCQGKSGHAEVVRITFDPKQITYNKLLEIFWEIHDPTHMNRQGPDVGYQYRSVIFYFDNNQKRQAQESLRKEQNKHSRAIATVIEEASTYINAEDYHQNYLMKRGQASCNI
ncbi:MAG: peptide-methionine (S)-S-oxide reductase MsrA [Nanoarchaeota archaeon]